MATQNGGFQIRASLWLLGLALGLITIVGCAPTSDTVAPAATPANTVVLPAALRAFPQQLPVEGERARLTSIAEGQLALRDGCLRLASTDDATDSGYLIIWPGDYEVKEEDGVLAIYDGQGHFLAKVGDDVVMGGGEDNQTTPLTDTVFGLNEPTPAECPGPYWIMGDFVPPPGAVSAP